MVFDLIEHFPCIYCQIQCMHTCKLDEERVLSHLKHLQQCLLADLKPLKRLFFLHHRLTQSLQVPKLSAGHSPGNRKHTRFITSAHHQFSSDWHGEGKNCCEHSDKPNPSITDLKSSRSMITTEVYRLILRLESCLKTDDVIIHAHFCPSRNMS